MDTNDQTDQEIQEKAKRVEAIFDEAVARIKELEKKQHEIVDEFIKSLEEEKIKKIKKSIQGGE